jgi:RNA polymerase sigma factor (sigma-70 family)
VVSFAAPLAADAAAQIASVCLVTARDLALGCVPRVTGALHPHAHVQRTTSMTDAYLSRVAAGDRVAMRDCIERYSRLVWSLAVRLSPNRADAEDAVQDIFVSVWQNASRFDASRASEATFITVIARRRLIDRMRRAGKAVGAGAVDFDADAMPAAEAPALELTEEAKAARKAMGELPAERRRVVAMSVVEGLTQEEIAAQTKMPLGTVKSHLRRGLLAVREALTGATPMATMRKVGT